MEKYQKIMVGIDGSSQSNEALERGIELAQLYQAKLLLVTVENDGQFTALANGGMRAMYRIEPDRLDAQRRGIQEFMDKCVQKAQDAGIDVYSKVYYGESKTELAEVLPESEKIDLIVLGVTGLNRIERLLIGSNANYVVANAPCDVIIVK